MDKKRALSNLKVTGWLFISLGFIALIGTALFWRDELVLDIVMNILFGIGMIYFGKLILSSQKVLST